MGKIWFQKGIKKYQASEQSFYKKQVYINWFI